MNVFAEGRAELIQAGKRLLKTNEPLKSHNHGKESSCSGRRSGQRSGLFHYLEAFFENGIPFRTFAVAETPQVTTNSGVALRLDDTVSRLAGREEEYDALVFACGDAMPKFAENADKPFNREMLRIMKRFAEQGKPMIGHCAAALLYDNLGIARGRRVALHPFIKTVVRECIPTDDKAVVDGNFYTAQTENTLSELMPRVLQALK